MSESTYSRYRREQATRSLNLRRRIEAMGDTELMGLWDDETEARFNTECTKEIHAEWAVDARKIAPESEGCDCDVCAIGRALRKGTGSSLSAEAHALSVRCGDLREVLRNLIYAGHTEWREAVAAAGRALALDTERRAAQPAATPSSGSSTDGPH